MRIALLQINPTPGDLEGNCSLIARGAQESQIEGADLVLTPELSVMGYLPRDLLLNRSFVRRSWDAACCLARTLRSGPPVLVGVATENGSNGGRPLFNSALLLRHGKVEQVFHKSLLPTYDVFDEDRYFEPARGEAQILKLGAMRFGVSICEDVWNDRDFWRDRRYYEDPIERLAGCGIDAVLNLSASPFTVGKQRLRESMLAHLARKHGLPVAYVNQVGGNDDLIFDGRSLGFDSQGHLIARAQAFSEDLITVDFSHDRATIASDDGCPESEIWSALVLGVRDYVAKSGFSTVLLGLSGGIDSAVTAAIAVDAVGHEHVTGVLMPSPYSSTGSIEDSLELARRLSIRTITFPISDIMQAYDGALSNIFSGEVGGTAEENLQARIRGNLLMALSNKFGWLLLSTGNKSELAVGYCTLYGDMSGGLAVIGDVPKTMVYKLANWHNQSRAVIPEPILTKAPSAELKPGQKDQDTLPPYEILDDILEKHIERCLCAEEIHEGSDSVTVRRVLKMVKSAEFKRKQAAPVLKITTRAFGSGWRMPIVREE